MLEHEVLNLWKAFEKYAFTANRKASLELFPSGDINIWLDNGNSQKALFLSKMPLNG